jgi:two-component system cell cycle response regulator
MSQKVLIIDDSPVAQQFIRGGLKDEMLELRFATNGTDGVAIASAESPDLILLDVEMPAPDGFQTCRMLKSAESTKDIPIIFLTSRTSVAEKVSGLDLGASDYVTKPFDTSELCARVRTALRTKYMSDLLRKRAMIDGLTGLWNRSYFDERLHQETGSASRYGVALSVIMADIDHFKGINDTHGHPVGDRVLRTVAETLASCCRREDTACRYGGEEFAILAPRVTERGSRVLAERIRQTIWAGAMQNRGIDVRVSCSFGVAQLVAGQEAGLVESADRALYRAKESGRNRVVGASEETISIAQRLPA